MELFKALFFSVQKVAEAEQKEAAALSDKDTERPLMTEDVENGNKRADNKIL